MITVAEKKAHPLGERLRTLREAAGYTQQEVATELGVAYQTYFRWEQGRTEPTFSHLSAMARMFGVKLNDFEAGAEEE